MKIPQGKAAVALIKETARGWMASDAPRLGAALAFYTVFSLAPLFVIVLAIASMWFGEEAARRELFGQLGTLLGREGSEAIRSAIASADRPKAGAMATILGGAAL